MKKLINTVASLAVAAMSTMITVMGAAWILGDCQYIFKIFGVTMIAAGIYGLAYNYIRTNEQSYIEQ